MTVLKIQNDYSCLITDDVKLKETLYNALRFKEKGYYHSMLYKQKRWDGYRNFFSEKTGKFLTGLLPEVLTALKMKGVEYEVKDFRSKVNFITKEIDQNWLDGVTLRDYQVDLINAAIKYKRGIIYAPTSAGKTNIALGFMKTIEPNTPTLFLANRKTLVHQNWKEMNEAGIEAGRLYDKYNEKKPIMCATVQSLHKIEDMLQDFKVLIVDEIHEMTSAGPKKAYNKLKGASVRLAVSATPFKFGGKDACQKYTVKGYFGPVFKSNAGMSDGILTTKKLQEKSILSASKCTFYHVNEPQIPYAIYLDAVTQGIAESYHFHDIVRDLAMTLTGRTLILVERIPHGDALFNMIPNALWIQGKDDLETREYVINELKENKKGVIGIATQQIFNTGVNVYVNNLINAAGGKAEHLIIQRMGRGLRTADDKSILNYYDFIFNINDYLLQHSNKRVKILKDEGHDVTIKKHLDFRK